ncbi:MAG: hypothetical protein MJ132_09070, partial [Clostridia bacterium]|nr:hypothetical protein [Clostridia bacterium]
MKRNFLKKTIVFLVVLGIMISSVWFIAAETETDISSSLSVSLWNATGNANELTYASLRFPSGALNRSIAYGILDNAAYQYIGDFIEFCGKPVNQINAETDTSGYTFSTFPSTADAKYRLPIILFQNGNTIEIKVHNTYLATVSDEIGITVKAGLSFTNDGRTYGIKRDVSFRYFDGSWTSGVEPTVQDISDRVAVSQWNTTGSANELTYAILSFPSDSLPAGINYGILDNVTYQYIGDYILFCGKPVNQINAETDTSGYTFSTFPSTADAKY